MVFDPRAENVLTGVCPNFFAKKGFQKSMVNIQTPASKTRIGGSHIPDIQFRRSECLFTAQEYSTQLRGSS